MVLNITGRPLLLMIREGNKNSLYYLPVHVDVEQRSEFYVKQNESKFVFASAAHILKFGGNATLIINRVLFVSFTYRQ